MNIFENYNSAKQKYGEKLVQTLLSQGIPDEYLLSAARFYSEEKIDIDTLRYKFKQWNVYVKPCQRIDVNHLDFKKFNDTILIQLKEACVPNKIYDDGSVAIGEFKSFKNAKLFPINNNWCVSRQNKWFNYYKSGCEHMLIIRYEQNKYVLALLEKGNISFIDVLNHEIADNTQECEKLEKSLGVAMNVIYNLADDYDRKIRNNNNIKENNMKKVVRLTENDLHRIVKNSVNRILRENYEEEGLMNTVKGVWQGATQGANQMASNNSAMHTVSSALSQALTYFGQIHKLIAPLQQQNPQIAQAVQLCMQAYKECKGQMNSTYGTNNVTSQYGALPQQQ